MQHLLERAASRAVTSCSPQVKAGREAGFGPAYRVLFTARLLSEPVTLGSRAYSFRLTSLTAVRLLARVRVARTPLAYGAKYRTGGVLASSLGEKKRPRRNPALKGGEQGREAACGRSYHFLPPGSASASSFSMMISLRNAFIERCGFLRSSRSICFRTCGATRILSSVKVVPLPWFMYSILGTQCAHSQAL